MVEGGVSFAHRVNRVPGLQEVATYPLLRRFGVDSWEAFGAISDTGWAALKLKMPQKASRKDLNDKTKLGVGHINALNELRAEAVRDFRRVVEQQESEAMIARGVVPVEAVDSAWSVYTNAGSDRSDASWSDDSSDATSASSDPSSDEPLVRVVRVRHAAVIGFDGSL